MNALRYVRQTSLVLLLLSVAARTQQPDSASFKIRFPQTATQFHVGETIPIDLLFSSSLPDTFRISTRSYDRSGGQDEEQFHVNPEGRDPLRLYYDFGRLMFGGLAGVITLTSDPHVLHEDLNEWIALDHPGHYSLYVTTKRVFWQDATRNGPIELRSNSLDFDVVAADPAWLQQSLFTAQSILDNPSSTGDEKIAALRTLRFLDSPASVRELIRQLAKPDSRLDKDEWDPVAGLAGSRQQAMVVRELEQQLGSPDTAITQQYLYILAKLKSQLDKEPLPAYPQDDQPKQAAWRELWQKRSEEFDALQNDLYRTTAAQVQKKWGSAKAETVRTLLMRPASTSSDVRPLNSVPEGDIVSSFRALSPYEQESLLSTFWERLNLPAMTAPLGEIAQQPHISNSQLRDVALLRLYQLDATAATPLFLEEIANPHVDNNMFTVSGDTLGLLPNETLPQFDLVLAARLENKETSTADLDAQLAGRYATKAVLARMKAAYVARQGDWNCKSEDGFVLYFLRVDPDYGVKRLQQAPSFCMTKSIPAVIRMKRWREIEPAIIANMSAPDLNRARQAAETLAQYGDEAAEEAMWKRLKAFHEQWAEREKDLAYGAKTPPDASEAIGFQYGIVTAMGQAQAWLLSDKQITELEQLTLGQTRDNAKPWHWTSPVDMNISLPLDGRVQADIHQYHSTNIDALCRKLAQYPNGTTFHVTLFGQREKLAPVIQSIQEVASDHGLIMDIGP
jgi:hypothetical protein